MEYPNYKVIEVAPVTDEELEKAINSQAGKGWLLDGIHFAMRESSRRPSMAFVVFTSTGNKESE